MHNRSFIPLLICTASACSVYGEPAADNGGAAGAGVAGSMTIPGTAGMGGSGEPGGNTVVGTGGAIDDGSAMESQVVGEVEDASIEAVMEAAPDTAAPCAGFALQFSGFSYVRINRPVQDDFTLEAWIKTSAASLTGTRHWEGSGLLWADASGNKDDYGVSILNNKVAFGVGNPGGTEPTIVSTSLVVNSQWTHVAVTRSKATGTLNILVNGVQESTMVLVTQLKSLTGQINMTLGGDVIDNRYFTGLMDEVRAWNVVRTAAEITATMHQKLAGNEPGLVGYWRFDEGSGTTAADGTATKNNGDIFAAPNWVASDAPVCP